VESIRHGHRITALEEDITYENQQGDHRSVPMMNMIRGVSQQGELVALLEQVPGTDEWQPKKVFFS
jgi:tRNA pseudouridine55 synthase